MVHTFKRLGRYFALDVESGSIYQINKLTKLLIDRKISPLDTDKGGILGYSKKAVSKAGSEIDALINEGALFSSISMLKINKEPVVKALCLNISHACTLNCSYCFAGGGSYGGSNNCVNMNFETAKAAIDFLISKSGSRKNLEVDFFGGEPLLNFDVVRKTVEYARSIEGKYGKNFRFTLTTNGLSLIGETVDFLNAEMSNVVISIDGRKNVHDSVRPRRGGGGSYDEAVKNALSFRKTRGDKSYYIRGTFTQKNKDFSADVLELNSLGFDQISLEPVVLPNSHPLALKNDDINVLKNEYEKLARAYLRRRRGKKWFSFFHFNMDFSGGPCAKKRLAGCGAGGEYLAVSTDGTLYPCHRFDSDSQYKIGSVFKPEALNGEVISKFTQSNVTTKKDCADCFCKYFCSGGCAANSIEFAGGINNVHTFSCALMRTRAELSMAIYAIESKKSGKDCEKQ